MIEQYEFAKQLRNLLRRADTFGYDLQRLKEEVLSVAEIQEENAERIEIKMIIESQRQQWEEDMILAENCGVELQSA